MSQKSPSHFIGYIQRNGNEPLRTEHTQETKKGFQFKMEVYFRLSLTCDQGMLTKF